MSAQPVVEQVGHWLIDGDSVIRSGSEMFLVIQCSCSMLHPVGRLRVSELGIPRIGVSLGLRLDEQRTVSATNVDKLIERWGESLPVSCIV